MTRPIVHRQPSSEEIRQRIREAPLVAIRELLPDQDILDACQACEHEYRDRRYGPPPQFAHPGPSLRGHPP